MCGFTGFVGEIKDRDKILTDMMNTIIHRGPDSAGKYIDEEAALGFRRLSIIDLSKAGDQPLYNEDKTMALVFNGEIYNYKELKSELIRAGHIFKSNTDSETLLHGYEEWGEKLLGKLRGMYAFAIWNIKKKELFLARDIFGIKPLYYSYVNKTLLFGSEIKSLLKHPNFEKIFNESVLPNYLSFQFVPTNETFFKNVFCLKPGHFLTFENNKLEIKKYFDFDFTLDNKEPLDKVVNNLENIIKESIDVHKISDVEVGSYLSSGVDSSYLTYLGKVDHTFTVGFNKEKYSEIKEAKEFAESINVLNHEKVISPDEYWDSLSDIQYYMDEPVADPSAIALYFLSKEASKKVKVVISGEGSDELFGGYNIYLEPLCCTKFDKIPFFIRRGLGKFAEYCLPRGLKGRGFFIRHGKTLEERYFGNATNIFTEREVNKLLKNGCKNSIKKVIEPIYNKVKDKDSVTKMQYLDLHLWLTRDILIKSDKMGMANSVEVRVPFLDKKVLKFAESLPLNCKVNVATKSTKIALRAAAKKNIKTKTAEKKKLGFPVPIRVWLKDDKYYNRVKEMFESEVSNKFFNTDLLIKMLDNFKNNKNRNEKSDDSRRIWTVYIFILWYNRFFS